MYVPLMDAKNFYSLFNSLGQFHAEVDKYAETAKVRNRANNREQEKRDLILAADAPAK